MGETDEMLSVSSGFVGLAGRRFLDCEGCSERFPEAEAHRYEKFWLCDDCRDLYDESEWKSDREEGLPGGTYSGPRCLCHRSDGWVVG